jgi:hypothetical protein
VAGAAEAALADRQSVSPIDVLCGVRWLHEGFVEAWRKGRLDRLEGQMAVTPERLDLVLQLLEEWATERGLQPTETSYVAATRDRPQLRFTRDGDEARERACRMVWISPDLSQARRRQLTERQNRAPDLVVIMPLKDFECTSCAGGGSFLFMEGEGPLCLACADMDHLVFLPSGDATLSRRAKKESRLSAVVVRFSRSRRRYERQGVLVEEDALERAEEQCLADEELRQRRRLRADERRADQDLEFQARMAARILELFPGCLPQRAEAIARHAGERESGRVGRTAAGRVLDEEAVTGAVIASIRHQDTGYDAMLMAGRDRQTARALVWEDVGRVLEAWREG